MPNIARLDRNAQTSRLLAQYNQAKWPYSS
jgi:hypothetical protein